MRKEGQNLSSVTPLNGFFRILLDFPFLEGPAQLSMYSAATPETPRPEWSSTVATRRVSSNSPFRELPAHPVLDPSDARRIRDYKRPREKVRVAECKKC